MGHENASILKACPLLRSFTETGLQIIAAIAEPKQVPAGAPLFVEQMIGDSFFVIVEGLVRLTVRGPNGREVDLVTLGPFESLGEAAILRSGPRLCTAIADIPTRVLEIARRDVAALQRTKPQAALKLMIAVVDRLADRTLEATPDLREFVAWKSGAH
ncbi:MAG: cyclic nucleotide-binding domain-containing protein [Deltaproteobacteria bacterium]|nr:cyclic nucleotide-binding domain-containing protein [Deltaproteobacteria bacterium]